MTGMSMLVGLIKESKLSTLVANMLDALTVAVFGRRLKRLRRIVDETGKLPKLQIDFVKDVQYVDDDDDDERPDEEGRSS